MGIKGVPWFPHTHSGTPLSPPFLSEPSPNSACPCLVVNVIPLRQGSRDSDPREALGIGGGTKGIVRGMLVRRGCLKTMFVIWSTVSEKHTSLLRDV